MSCTYSILESPMGVENYFATLRLIPVTESDHTFAEWTAEFDARARARRQARRRYRPQCLRRGAQRAEDPLRALTAWSKSVAARLSMRRSSTSGRSCAISTAMSAGIPRSRRARSRRARRAIRSARCATFGCGRRAHSRAAARALRSRDQLRLLHSRSAGPAAQLCRDGSAAARDRRRRLPLGMARVVRSARRREGAPDALRRGGHHRGGLSRGRELLRGASAAPVAIAPRPIAPSRRLVERAIERQRSCSTRYGGPEVLEPRTVRVPAPGPGEARIRQTAIGVNFIDVYCRRGSFDLVTPPAFSAWRRRESSRASGPASRTSEPGDRVGYACAPPGAYAAMRDDASRPARSACRIFSATRRPPRCC